jgi:osmotically-inducible protein OsmY
VVTLQGKVRTEKARQKAESVAGKVKGVKRVVNHLLVTPT